MPETVDKSSLSTLFPRYSPQLRLIDFFFTQPRFRGVCTALCLCSPSPRLPLPASLCLFSVSFLLHLPSSVFIFLLFRYGAPISQPCSVTHSLDAAVKDFLFPPASFPFSFRRAVPPPCFPFLPFRFSFASFCFRLILLPPHFAFAASSSAYGFLLSFAFPGRDACAFIPPCYTVHIFSLSQLYEHIHTQGGSQHDR